MAKHPSCSFIHDFQDLQSNWKFHDWAKRSQAWIDKYGSGNPRCECIDTKPHLIDAAESCEGWISGEEGLALFHYAQDVTSGVIVEIGSWKGKSTIYLGAGARGERTRVFAIDPFKGSPIHQVNGPVFTLPEFLENIQNAGLLDVVTPLTLSSLEARKLCPFTVAVLFIDGDHDSPHPAEDIEAWEPLVKVGGRIAFHDAYFPGVVSAIGWVKQTGLYEEGMYHANIWTAIKVGSGATVVQA